MTEQEKQELIERCIHDIAWIKSNLDNFPGDTEEMIADLQIKEIALASLTAQPVKIPDLRQSVSGDRYVWADGAFNYRNDVIAAIRAAGYEVQE